MLALELRQGHHRSQGGVEQPLLLPAQLADRLTHRRLPRVRSVPKAVASGIVIAVPPLEHIPPLIVRAITVGRRLRSA